MLFENQNIEEHFEMVETTLLKCSDLKIKRALKTFIEQPKTYKKQYLQTNYNQVFDGYSYLGQTDSTNQYDTDLLHSFVLSEFTKKTCFPKEFHAFLDNDWNDLIIKIKSIELEVIKRLNIPELILFYKTNIGHMLSCNYYPKVDAKQEAAALRLSKHKDVSLFTVFVFGMKKGFGYSNYLGEVNVLNDTHKVVVFPGYLLEYLSNGKFKALEHQVNFDTFSKERFSFAFFSILKPSQHLVFDKKHFTSAAYYKNYLSLF